MGVPGQGSLPLLLIITLVYMYSYRYTIATSGRERRQGLREEKKRDLINQPG